MGSAFFLEFDAYDNPMQLSKVGNWVITFLSPKDQEHQIQLAITNVLPRQISAQLQPRRIVIQQSADAQQWQIQQIDCFDSQTNQEISFQARDTIGQTVIQRVIQEFDKYDVSIQLIENGKWSNRIDWYFNNKVGQHIAAFASVKNIDPKQKKLIKVSFFKRILESQKFTPKHGKYCQIHDFQIKVRYLAKSLHLLQ